MLRTCHIASEWSVQGDKSEPMADLDKFVKAHKYYAYGEQRDVWDQPNCIAWVHTGSKTDDNDAGDEPNPFYGLNVAPVPKFPDNLLGRQGHRFLLFGMLSTSSDGRYELEGVDGTIGLDLHDAIPGEGILTEGSLILVEGEYTVDECIRAFAIGHPPSETRAQARLIHAHTVFLAHFANVATIAIAYDYASHTKATSNSILMGMSTITALEAALSAPIDLLLDPGLTTSMLPVSRMEAIMTRPGCVQPAFDFSLTTGACIATLPVLKRRRYNNHRGRLMNGDWLLSLSSMPLRGAVTAKAALLLATPPLKYPSDCTTAGSLFLRLSISVQVNVST
ncbi:uncharacterized protein UHOD_11655 [Ustilago sp. UG-2017b]|nr:uncharacterized protein UHOD_11655 [Ustilago sp. UG-2017b]